MAVDITTTTTLEAGKPWTLFSGPYNLPDPVRGYDVTLDGRRFLMVDMREDVPPQPPTHMIVVLNWLEELKRRVPTR